MNSLETLQTPSSLHPWIGVHVDRRPIPSSLSKRTLVSRVKWWPAVAGLAAVAFVAGLFPYTDRYLFWRDDNLAYLDYVALDQAAVASIPDGHNLKVITVWPGSSEVSKSWLGYANQPLQDIEIDLHPAKWPAC